VNREASEAARAIASRCLAVRVRRLGRLVTRIYDAALAPYGMSTAQMNLLAAIGVLGEARPANLIDILDMEKSTLSRDLKRMQQLGWVQAAPARAGRGHTLALTPAGARLLVEVLPAWEEAQAKARAELGRGAFAQLRKLLG
jgi:DNA-binding MarR family transcriptional regulator